MYRMLIIGKKIGLKDWFICYNCATGGGGGKLYWILQQKPPQLIYSSRVLWFNRPMRDELEFWLKNNFILPPSPSLHPPSTLDLTALFTIYLFSYRPDFGYQICCEPLCPPPPMSEYDWIWPLFSRNQLLRINESLSPTRPLPPPSPMSEFIYVLLFISSCTVPVLTILFVVVPTGFIQICSRKVPF